MKSPLPHKEDKNTLRKIQILKAAKGGIIKNGFHATTMAQIADLSGLSVGVIYRYFASKEEIINEIVKMIVDKRLHILTTLAFNLDEIAAALTARVGMGTHDEEFSADNILMFEVMAEASRNAHVAAIYQEADDRMFTALREKFIAHQPDIDRETAEAQVEIMMSLFAGTDTRFLYKRKMNEVKLRTLHDKFLSSIFNVKSLQPGTGRGD